ncbi:MAG: LacI family DNA-binding transcriptional regulator [Sphaerochaetaceae bacterium]
MAILKDIADMAQVSISTVSRALQNDPKISYDTKKKIVSIATSLGYSKHKLKNNCISTDWNSVGFIVPEVTSGYYSHLVHVANEQFEKKKYSMTIKLTNFDDATLIRHIYSFNEMQVTCIIVILDDSENISDELLTAVSITKLPVLFITTKHIANLDFDNLYIDEHKGIELGLKYLVNKRYKHIGFIGERQTMARCSVYKDVMESFSLPVRDCFVRISNKRNEEAGYESMKEILSLEQLPDAIFASYDQMAIGAIHAIEEAGLRIPEDIAILGFDDIPIAQYINKGLTTIRDPYDDMIAIAVRVLLQRVEHPESATQRIILKPSIIKRGTT